jgi:hypothetical protein
MMTMAPGIASPRPPLGGMKNEPTSIATPGTMTQIGQVVVAKLNSRRRPSRTATPMTTRITPTT